MMTKDQIEASIAALKPAPEHETLQQVAARAAEWMLSTIADEHPAIAETRSLYSRVINDSGEETAPTEADWHVNIEALDRARARARARARDHALAHALEIDLARALARARALELELDLDLDNSLAFARALVSVVVRLVETRIEPLKRLDGAVLAALSAPGCGLNMDVYHACETTHCRAGWAITLHPMGRELEEVFGPWLAGAVIYQVSTGRVPNFFASDEDAMADIRRCARAEAA